MVDVEHRIRSFFAGRLDDAAHYGSEYEHLWQAASRASAGGKRLRPMLVLVAHGGVHGSDAAQAVELAVAFELLHTAFLLHDDVIDGDEVRRGVPNVVGEFGLDARRRAISEARAEQWGRTAAILAGDLLIHYSQSLVARLDVDRDTRIALLDVLDRGVFVTAAGELADVSYSVGVTEPRLTDALDMTERKTAAYSFEAPLIAGAILGGADRECIRALGEYGRLLGVAFQLGDDLLGTFGAEGVTGKSVVNDLREGKETPLVSFARATDEWARVDDLFGRPDLSPKEADRLRSALELCGARAFVESLVADHVRDAVAALDVAAVPAGLASQLEGFAGTCIGRAS
ncbi:polyprenyl synthetase family protein [Diaminobutyricibacter tongyongensis]|uniref:Polyprenyl synthetase family protein n=2 Tax=Leifsonia tongyongensis TaxID=1268043 RepID=A0A6L9XX94_9MICO|nr:polyprenyl synthetase family protein [Diaminobutyricibacter tongyongensis]